MDRIKAIHIENVRAIESMTVDLSDGMTVLIGENGSGKSTIIECLELLRHAADPHFMERFYDVHRGMPGMLRAGATSFRLGVDLADSEGGQPTVKYRFGFRAGRSGAELDGAAIVVNKGEPDAYLMYSPNRSDRPLDDVLTLSLQEQRPAALDRLVAALRGIETHIGFETTPTWVARSLQWEQRLRRGSTVRPADRLDLLGRNLANAWHELRNRDPDAWAHTLSLLALGLGDRVRDVVVVPDPGGGEVHLGLRFRGMVDPVMAPNLSDGQLAWLAFVAMTRLNEGRSLLAIDEPDRHLHPHLLAAVVALLQNVKAPVLVSTHSDRWLELLEEPADAVRVCGLDDEGRATIAKLDPEALDTWLADFGDLAQLRAAGYLDRVLRPADADSA